MSKKEILNRTTVKRKKGHEFIEIIGSEKYYCIFYEGKPINIKIISPNGSLFYNKTAFLKEGYAKRLCKKLNNIFKTNKFEVWEVEKTKKIS